MEYEESGGEEKKISKFNAGIAIQIRLDRLWTESHFHSRSGQFKKWNSDLDCIWIELAGDVEYREKKDKKEKGEKEDERDSKYFEFKKKFDSFDIKLRNLGRFEDNISDGFEAPTKEQITRREEQYQVLVEKSLFLKRLEKYLGKGTNWDNDEYDDF